MADSFDFGFTAVDQDELTTKTGESAALNEKIAEDLKELDKTLGSSYTLKLNEQSKKCGAVS